MDEFIALLNQACSIDDETVNTQEDYRKRVYERYASQFQDAHSVFDVETAHRWGKAYEYYLRNWLPADSNAAILEVACGGGRLLHFLKTRGYARVSGIDISPEQVHLSRQVIDEVEEANALEFLEEHSDAFDIVVALDVVEHFNKNEMLRFLDGCHNALKRGGTLILQTPNADSPWGTMHRYNDFTHEIALNSNAITRLLRMVGFDAVATRELGPVPFGYSMTSTIRAALWWAIRCGLKFWNLIETGHAGSGVLTRVFLICARK